MNGIEYPPRNPFLKSIWNRTHRYHKNWIQVVTGEPGAGKSYVTLALAERLDKYFTVDDVCFTLEQFFDILERIQNERPPKRGRVIVFDEMGITMSARKWWSETNQMINKVLQTFRYLNIITFFVVPDFSFIDAQARKVVQCFSEVKRERDNPPDILLYKLRQIRKDGDMHFIYPRVLTAKGRRKMPWIKGIPLPSEGLMRSYEEKMRTEKQKIAKADIDRMKAERLDEIKKKKNIKDDVEFIIENISDFKNTRGKLDWDIIRAKLDCSQAKARQLKKLVELDEAKESVLRP